MKVIDDGIIKYDRTNFSHSSPLPLIEYTIIEYWRKKLHDLNLIGEYPKDKIGFGNISLTADYSHLFKSIHPQFIISGTQTGKYSTLNGSHYTRILDYSINNLQVKMEGVIEASSEVLTHAALYSHNPLIKAVFHIHSFPIWDLMISENFPHTAIDVPYGTVEMALATQKCIGNTESGIFYMHGHADGVVAYGRTPEETWNQIFKLYERTI